MPQKVILDIDNALTIPVQDTDDALALALASARALETAAHKTDLPGFWVLADQVSGQLLARGVDIRGKSVTISVIRALLRDLAGHKASARRGRLPRVDRELAGTLLEIAAWMRRFSRHDSEEILERLGDLDLLGQVHARAGGLFAVP